MYIHERFLVCKSIQGVINIPELILDPDKNSILSSARLGATGR